LDTSADDPVVSEIVEGYGVQATLVDEPLKQGSSEVGSESIPLIEGQTIKVNFPLNS